MPRSDHYLGSYLSADDIHIVTAHHAAPYHNILIGFVFTSRPLAKVVTLSTRHPKENYCHSLSACASVPGNSSRSMAKD